jgi:hypothetical protein
MATSNELSEALMRFQEFYESTDDDIKGNIFTVGYLKSKGSQKYPGINDYAGGIHYDSRWGGFNFPDYVLRPFITGLFDPLTTYEQDIVEALRYRTDKFYVIGIADDEDYVIGIADDEESAVDHEICHALYYLNDKYHKAVNKALSDYDMTNFEAMLMSWGYSKDVLKDETHAYISADHAWLMSYKADDLDKFKVPDYRELHKVLRKIKKKYFKEEV